MMIKRIVKKITPTVLLDITQKVKKHFDCKLLVACRTLTFVYNNKLRKRKQEDNILFIPCTSLNGSFGDELMTIAFLEMNKNKSITLYTDSEIKNKGLFESYNNIAYMHYRTVPMYSRYQGGVSLMGADIMTGVYGIVDIVRKCKMLAQANSFNLKTKILGFSFHNDNVSQVVKNALSSLLPQTEFNLRDKDSYLAVEQFLPKSNLNLVADLAFMCPLYDNKDNQFLKWVQTQKNAEKLIVAVCPNSLQAKKVGKDKYLMELTNLLKHIGDTHNVAFALLYHDIRKVNFGDVNYSDKDFSRDIYNLLDSNYQVIFTETIVDGVQLKTYLPFVDFTLTGRMHFGISGYSVGKPMFGIAYEGKFSGLQKLFNINEVESTIDYRDLNSATDIISSFIDKLDTYTTLVQNNLPKVLELSKKNHSK